MRTFTSRQPPCAADSGLRRVFEERRSMGSPTLVCRLRSCQLLRFIQESACDEALPCDASPGHSFAHLMHEALSQQSNRRAQIKNYFGVSLYAIAAGAAFVSIYISFFCFLIVPAMYFIPEKIVHEDLLD